MNSSLKHINLLLQIEDNQVMLVYAQNRLKKLSLNELASLDILAYSYVPDKAIDELGLDLELLDQLLEDYVTQILKSNTTFISCLIKLQEESLLNKVLNYTPLRELAHKNLGVAKNLRIDNIQKILDVIIKSEDLNLMYQCLEGLLNSVVVLKPHQAFKTIMIMKSEGLL